MHREPIVAYGVRDLPSKFVVPLPRSSSFAPNVGSSDRFASRTADLFVQIVLQLTTAVLLGILTAQPWAQSTVGGMTVLVVLLLLQLTGAFWSFYHTANDLIDGLEKGVVYLIEAAALVLLLASSIVGQKEEGAETDLEKLALSLKLATSSATVLLAGIFFPMFITVCKYLALQPSEFDLLLSSTLCICERFSLRRQFVHCPHISNMLGERGSHEGCRCADAAQLSAVAIPDCDQLHGYERGGSRCGCRV